MQTKRASTLLFFCTVALLVAVPGAAYAQHGPRHIGGTRSVVVVRGAYYSPYYYDPFFSPFWWSYPAPYYGARYWPYAAYDNRAGVRLQVTPKQTEVFVDGYVAGTVDDFDGVFQRLSLPPGEHELVLYLPGYRTVRQKVYLNQDAAFRIRHTMEALPPGESNEPRPEALSTPPQGMRVGPPRALPRGPMTGSPMAAPPQAALTSNFGTLAIRVQPGDAEVLIDGERWQSTGPEARLSVQVPEGSHHIEIRKDGYQTFISDVQVRSGETAGVNVSLSQRE